jgi:hypothetical protein
VPLDLRKLKPEALEAGKRLERIAALRHASED